MAVQQRFNVNEELDNFIRDDNQIGVLDRDRIIKVFEDLKNGAVFKKEILENRGNKKYIFRIKQMALLGAIATVEREE